MTDLSPLLDVNPETLIGRDPASLIADALDPSSQDILRSESDALSALASSSALGLPFGRARDLAVEISPLLCSIARDRLEAARILRTVHGWIVGMGDARSSARAMDAADAVLRLVAAEHGDVDMEVLARISPEDHDAVLRYEELDRITSLRVPMDGCSVVLSVLDADTLGATLRTPSGSAVVGIARLDGGRGGRAAEPQVPQLAA